LSDDLLSVDISDISYVCLSLSFVLANLLSTGMLDISSAFIAFCDLLPVFCGELITFISSVTSTSGYWRHTLLIIPVIASISRCLYISESIEAVIMYTIRLITNVTTAIVIYFTACLFLYVPILLYTLPSFIYSYLLSYIPHL
jgi:hypothetical protein